MNEQTQQLLEKMAVKFGTTAEHLWGVLIAQAKIESIISIVQLIVLMVAWAVFWRFMFKIRLKWKEESGDWFDSPEIILPFVLVGLGLFIGTVCWGDTRFSVLVSGFLNPEFWALQQILKP